MILQVIELKASKATKNIHYDIKIEKAYEYDVEGSVLNG